MKIRLQTDHFDFGNRIYGYGAVVDVPDEKARRMVAKGSAVREDGLPLDAVPAAAGIADFYRLAALGLAAHHSRRAEMARAAGAPEGADADAQKAVLLAPPDASALPGVVAAMSAVEQGWA